MEVQMTKLEARPTVRFRGLRETAAEVGCSVFHLREVLNGRRKAGPELEAKLAERGIETPAMRRARRRRGAAFAVTSDK